MTSRKTSRSAAGRKLDADGIVAVAERFNLTDAEALVVARRFEREGQDLEQAALQIRSERVGPAADPEFRPLPDDTIEALDLEDEIDPATGEPAVTHLGDVPPSAQVPS